MNAQPLPYTHLSLDRYASLLGIGPCNFNGAVATPFWPTSDCQDVFYRHPWQNEDHLSREDIAYAIKQAEDDLAAIVGFPLAPTWIAEEIHPYPHHYRPEVYTWIYNVRDQHISITADWRKTIGGGVRAVTLLSGRATVTYLDLDLDGFFETGRVTCATTLTDVREVKVYFYGMGGAQEWEIRPAKSKSITAGVFTADFWTWQLIDPDNQDSFPSSSTDPAPLDLSGLAPAYVVGSVDIYWEYNDQTVRASQFWWEPLPITDICSLSTSAAFCQYSQDGFLLVREPQEGIVFPMTAEYDATNGWLETALTLEREPDLIKLWYYAGNIGPRYFQNTAYDPLDDQWALWIAMVATARLERTACTCSCGNTGSLFARWREDLAEAPQGVTRFVDFTSGTLDNPLGTHRGEVEVWKKIKRFHSNLGGVAV